MILIICVSNHHLLSPFITHTFPHLIFNVLIALQRINHSQEDLYPPPGGMRPDERMQPHYQHRDLDYPHRDLEYQRGPPGGKKENLTSDRIREDDRKRTGAPVSVVTTRLYSSLKSASKCPLKVDYPSWLHKNTQIMILNSRTRAKIIC